MAGKNIQNGISLIQTAERALQEVNSLLQRLMVKAANDTNTNEDCQMIQQEVEQILEEINRISDTTHFNNIALLKTDILTGYGKLKMAINLCRFYKTKNHLQNQLEPLQVSILKVTQLLQYGRLHCQCFIGGQ